jgi:ornithine cyclodeaminase/alanine dehydrogenase-like protein (mu-crystallin family)
VRLLTNDDLERVLGMSDCLDALETAYRDLACGQAMGGTTRVETLVPMTPSGDVLYEFTSNEGAVPAFGVMALRCNSNHMAMRVVDGLTRKDRLPAAPGGRFVGLVLLFSLQDLRLLAILQDGYLSAMRVGATSALAARELARPDAAVAAVLGSGDQARSHLRALAAVRPLREARVFSPNPARRQAYAEAMTAALGFPVRAVDSARAAADGADVFVAATNSWEPVFDLDCVAPGMHVSAILSFEVPAGLYERADRVFVHTQAGYGRGAAGHYDASTDWARYPSLDQLLAGQAAGRADPRQITFFMNNAGLGLQFAAVGARALALAEAAGAGQTLPDDLFLQTWHT